MLPRWFEALAFALASLACPCVVMAVSSGSYGGYTIRVWQSEDGLPQNTVTAITQTRDGYIWIGTLAGLARFDGERFLTLDSGNSPSLQDNRISALFEDSQGTLWIGHDTGLVTCYRQGRFDALPGEPGRQAKISAIGADENGTIWLLRTSGVLERATAPESKEAAPAGSDNRQVRFSRNAAGRIWFSVDGNACELRGGQVHPIDMGPARNSGYVRAICASADAGRWVVRDGRIRKWTAGQWSEERGAWGLSEINSALELRDGSLALATMDDGFHLIRPDGTVTVFNRDTALIQNWARVLFEDREGNLWIGAGAGGVTVVRHTDFAVLNSPDNWQGCSILAVAPGKDGALWIGTEGAGLYRCLHNEWKRYSIDQGIENQYVWAVASDAEGQIWAGTWAGCVYRLQGEKFVRVPELSVGTAPIFALDFSGPDHALWVGTGNGICRFEGGLATWLLHNDKPTATSVQGIARDDRGVTWLALGDGGLGRLANSASRRFGQHEGLSGTGVQCLLPDGDVLWIGTREGGLNRLKAGKFSSVSIKQGLPSKVICHIADDGHGYLWLSTHHGIFRVAKDELNRCADGLIPAVAGQVYDKNDGLPTLEYSGGLQAAGCQTNDGRLWFTSSKGLVSVDPAAIRVNPLVPRVAIESLWVDGQAVALGQNSRVHPRLMPGHQRLEFQFTALSFAASSKSLFKYRMTGLDADWIDAGTKRTASYSQLPAGKYQFRVIACNNDQIWNTEGASLEFTVAPFYWQTGWFRSVTAFLVLSVVAWGVRFETRRRMQRRVEELEYERGLERERARIAQDIHDDIGSSLTRITMLSQSVRQDADLPYRAGPVLERIYDTALEVTHTLDEIVWALNPRNDTLDSLANYLASFAQDLLSEAGVRCRLDLPLNLPAWPLSTQIRHHLLLAFKEALSNALKHADATEIQVALEVGRNEFIIVIQDNGRGFDPAGDPAADANRAERGDGLGNLRQRLDLIGGICDITSAPGRGTRITFTVPVPNRASPPAPGRP